MGQHSSGQKSRLVLVRVRMKLVDVPNASASMLPNYVGMKLHRRYQEIFGGQLPGAAQKPKLDIWNLAARCSRCRRLVPRIRWAESSPVPRTCPGSALGPGWGCHSEGVGTSWRLSLRKYDSQDHSEIARVMLPCAKQS